MGYGWGWDVHTVGLYVTFGLTWAVAVVVAALSFWVDRRKPVRKLTEATLQS